jgi:hypothetical protein
MDIGYSFIKRMHSDQWQKHCNYPDKTKRPILCYHKTVRYYMAEAGIAGVPGSSDETADAEWVPLAEVDARLSHDEEKRVIAFMTQKRQKRQGMDISAACTASKQSDEESGKDAC